MVYFFRFANSSIALKIKSSWYRFQKTRFIIFVLKCSLHHCKHVKAVHYDISEKNCSHLIASHCMKKKRTKTIILFISFFLFFWDSPCCKFLIIKGDISLHIRLYVTLLYKVYAFSTVVNKKSCFVTKYIPRLYGPHFTLYRSLIFHALFDRVREAAKKILFLVAGPL